MYIAIYTGHQAHKVRDLALESKEVADELIRRGVAWAKPDDDD